jgi:hypothetical protein
MPNLNNKKQTNKSTIKQLHPTSLKEAIASHKSSNSVAAI